MKQFVVLQKVGSLLDFYLNSTKTNDLTQREWKNSYFHIFYNGAVNVAY